MQKCVDVRFAFFVISALNLKYYISKQLVFIINLFTVLKYYWLTIISWKDAIDFLDSPIVLRLDLQVFHPLYFHVLEPAFVHNFGGRIYLVRLFLIHRYRDTESGVL